MRLPLEPPHSALRGAPRMRPLLLRGLALPLARCVLAVGTTLSDSGTWTGAASSDGNTGGS